MATELSREYGTGQYMYPIVTSQDPKVRELINTIYRPEDIETYTEKVNQTFKDLGQTPTDYGRIVNGQIVGDRALTAQMFTTSLASPFIDKYYEMNKKLPSEDLVRRYVSESSTPDVISQYVTNTFGKDDFKTMADNYIKSSPDITQVSDTSNQAKSREIFGKNLFDLINQYQYYPEIERGLKMASARNIYTSPISQYIINQAEANKARSLREGAGDIERTIQAIRESDLTRANQQNQWRQAFQYQKGQDYFNRGLQNKALDISSQIGKLQAEANEPGILDYLNTAFQGLGSAGTTALAAKTLCWVAEELYGENSKKTNSIRKFLINKINEDSLIGRFARLYHKEGREWASMIKDNLSLRGKFKNLYDYFYQLAEASNG